MKNYLLIIPFLVASYALVIDVEYLYTYKQALFNELHGAGAAQWQMMFTYYHWPIVASLLALALALIINRVRYKLYISIAVVLSVTPLVLWQLVKYGYY